MSYGTKNARAALEWAEKQQRARERAERLREERQSGAAPQSRGRGATRMTHADSLDEFAAASVYPDHADTRQRTSAQSGRDLPRGAGSIPSPGSDALTYEMRRHASRNGRDPQAEAEETFYSNLRGHNGGREGGANRRPAWDNDFGSGHGLDARSDAYARTEAKRRADPFADPRPSDHYDRMRAEMGGGKADPFADPGRSMPADAGGYYDSLRAAVSRNLQPGAESNVADVYDAVMSGGQQRPAQPPPRRAPPPPATRAERPTGSAPRHYRAVITPSQYRGGGGGSDGGEAPRVAEPPGCARTGSLPFPSTPSSRPPAPASLQRPSTRPASAAARVGRLCPRGTGRAVDGGAAAAAHPQQAGPAEEQGGG